MIETNSASKVSMIVGDLSAEGAGRWGGAVRPFLLTKALQEAGIDVEILGFSNDDAFLSVGSEVSVKHYKKTIYPSFINSAIKLIQEIDGDIIYAYKTKVSSFGIGILAKEILRRPLILDIDDWEMSWHGGEMWRYQPSVRQRFRDLLKPDGALRQPDHPIYLNQMEKHVGYADKITVHNEFLRQRFGGIYVPNGKNTQLFDPELYDPDFCRKELELSQFRVIIFPGAPRPYKGVEDVLDALKILNEPDLKLVIVGGSPYDDYDQELKRKWGDWLIQLPKTSYEEMPKIIAASHLLVVPQRDEPAARAQFPLKLTDGMSMAKPILATRVGDIPDILGDTGYLVDANSPEFIAKKIRDIFANYEDALARGERARMRCQEYFSIKRMSQTLKDIFAF